jgi:hypothetical protein
VDVKDLLLLLLACAVAVVGCSRKEAAKEATEQDGSASSGNPLTAPVDYLGAQAQAKRTASKAISVAELTQAIQKFNAMEDRFPRDLNELVQQHYVQQLPVAPVGFRFAYNPETGDIKVVRQ